MSMPMSYIYICVCVYVMCNAYVYIYIMHDLPIKHWSVPWLWQFWEIHRESFSAPLPSKVPRLDLILDHALYSSSAQRKLSVHGGRSPSWTSAAQLVMIVGSWHEVILKEAAVCWGDYHGLLGWSWSILVELLSAEWVQTFLTQVKVPGRH